MLRALGGPRLHEEMVRVDVDQVAASSMLGPNVDATELTKVQRPSRFCTRLRSKVVTIEAFAIRGVFRFDFGALKGRLCTRGRVVLPCTSA